MVDELKEIKVCLLGDMGVGKSCLVLRFAQDRFDPHSATTIGASFITKTIQLHHKSYKFNIWDTAGQERFRSLAPLYYRDAAAAIIVYEINNQKSFTALKSWIREIQRHGPPDVILAIAGNKCDLENQREVTVDEAQDYAESVDAMFIETSAKTAKNVQYLFQGICDKIESRPEPVDGIRQGGMALRYRERAKNEKKCCS